MRQQNQVKFAGDLTPLMEKDQISALLLLYWFTLTDSSGKLISVGYWVKCVVRWLRRYKTPWHLDSVAELSGQVRRRQYGKSIMLSFVLFPVVVVADESCKWWRLWPTNNKIIDSVVEWLGRRTHDLRSRVRLPVTTLPGYLFLRQVTILGG